jgi:hypothetical protein
MMAMRREASKQAGKEPIWLRKKWKKRPASAKYMKG